MMRKQMVRLQISKLGCFNKKTINQVTFDIFDDINRSNDEIFRDTSHDIQNSDN